MAATPPRRQGRPPSMPDPRGRILDEAAALFAREGYDGTPLGALAEAVGVTKAAIYHYFPNKHDIFEAIIVRTLTDLRAHVRAATAAADGPEAALRAFMLAHAEYFEAHFDGFATMLVGFGGMRNRSLLAEAQKLRASYEADLRAIIARGIAEGAFRDADPAITGRAVLSMLNWMVRWFRPGGPRRATDFAADYLALILHGLRAEAAPAP